MLRKRITAIILTFAMVLSLSACGNSKRGSSYESLSMPSWIEDRKAYSLSSDAESSSEVHFYYDNTNGMYPFVLNSYEKEEPSGIIVHWMSSIREILQKNSGTVFTLQPDNNKILRWTEFDGDIRSNFSKNSFYTHNGNLPKEGNAVTGPLALLYYEKNIDPKAINIVLTDLAEQSVNLTELASYINREILSQDGYAAAIIAVNCPFNGTAYVPDPDKISTLMKNKVYDERPLYLILTGQEDRLKAIYDNLIQVMEESQSMEEGTDFYSVIQPPEPATARISDDAIVIPPSLEEADQTDFKKYSENSVFYDNFAVEAYSKSEVADLFGSETYLDFTLNTFSYQKSRTSDRLTLNYFIPLPNYKDSFEWRIGKSIEDDKTPTLSVQALEILENKDYLLYDYLISEEVEIEEDESEVANKTGKRERKKRPSKETIYYWLNEGETKTSLKDFEDAFELTAELLSTDEITKDMLSGAKLINKKGEVVSNNSSGRRGSSYELDKADEIDLSATDHWLHISIEGKGSKYQSSTVAFDIPIYGFVNTVKDVPSWVYELNADASERSSSNFYTHTFNLTGFYSTLFGASDLKDPEVYRIQREVKIADIISVITDLPTGKSRK